uniref:G-protein coupled receptors family 2 profile 2 domain-containing protein n=1 Tax=Biomphalaria glabrata TaxID=6526 RepID=A0A2C9L5M5_BIOGL
MLDGNSTFWNCTSPAGATANYQLYNGTLCWTQNITLSDNWDTNLTQVECCAGSSYLQSDNSLLKLAMNGAITHILLSLVSTVVVTVTFILLKKFRTGQTSRLVIHKNLLLAFFMYAVIVAVTLLVPVIIVVILRTRDSQKWVACITYSSMNFSLLSMFNWMLLEGIYLHMVVMKPLRDENIPKYFIYLAGWGPPTACIMCWCIVQTLETDDCYRWNDETLWRIILVKGPVILIMLVNLLILLNLIRIVILKLCRDSISECQRLWQTIKATVVLTFLLGVINIVQMIPGNDKGLTLLSIVLSMTTYIQVLFVSIYILFSSGVIKAIRRRWVQYKDCRSINNSRARVPLAQCKPIPQSFGMKSTDPFSVDTCEGEVDDNVRTGCSAQRNLASITNT